MAQILALDDVKDAVVLVKKILAKKGHAVNIFTDEDEALRYAENHPVDLAVLDIKLRKMEGTEVLAELKKLQPHMRAIMLTGYPTNDTALWAMSLGAAAYCVKPIDKGELEARVAEVLGQ